jgi:hypothetical protein
LLDGKEVEVPLTRGAIGFNDPLPGGSAEDRLPIIWRQLPALTLSITKYVAFALKGSWGGFEGLLEPFVLI